MNLVIFFAYCACWLEAVRSSMVNLPNASFGPLTTSGAQYISNEIKLSGVTFSQARDAMTQKNTECQSLKDAKTKNQCIPCILEKCKAKADSCNRKLNVVEAAISTLSDLGGKVTSTVKDVGHKVVDGIKKIFGGWGKRRISRRIKRSEPSCSDIEHNSGEACKKYEAFCSSCTFSAVVECPGYGRIKAVYDNAVGLYSWLDHVPKSGASYQVLALSYDPASFDPASKMFTHSKARVNVLSKTTSFRLNQPMSPFTPDTAGPIIAQQALSWFKIN